MAYPTKRDTGYSFTGFAQSQGDNSFPGSNLDTALANLKMTLDETVDFVTHTFRSDEVLKPTAIPSDLDISAYFATTVTSSEAAVAAALAAATSQSAAATSATNAATSATNAAITLTTALTKADNLASLASAATARTNLGLGPLATKTTIATSDVADNAITDAKVAAGAVVAVSNVIVSAVATGTSLIPYDDTIPQSTEGDQYMTLSHTPKATANKLRIDVVVFGSHATVGDFCSAALFKDSDAGALAAVAERSDTAGGKVLSFTYFMTAGTTSPIAFKVRAGGNSAGTFTFNGTGGARRFGGIAASSITITEIKG